MNLKKKDPFKTKKFRPHTRKNQVGPQWHQMQVMGSKMDWSLEHGLMNIWCEFEEDPSKFCSVECTQENLNFPQMPLMGGNNVLGSHDYLV